MPRKSQPKKTPRKRLTKREEKFVEAMADRPCYIYGIKPKDGEVFYIGSAVDVEKRFATHLRDCRNDRHTNALFLQKAYKIGLNNLSFEIIDTTTETHRLPVEYGHIQAFAARGLELVNIIRTERQQEFFLRARTVVKERTHEKAFALLFHSIKNQNNEQFTDWQRRGMRLVITKCRVIFAYPNRMWANSVFGKNAELAGLLLEVA